MILLLKTPKGTTFAPLLHCSMGLSDDARAVVNEDKQYRLTVAKVMAVESGTQLRAADEAAVRSLYRRMIEGWNRGSGADFAEPFAEDSRFIAFDGTCFRGREEIAVTHQRLFDTHLKDTHLTGKVLDVRFPDEDVAVLYATGSTVMRWKIEPSPERESVQTLVAVRTKDRWQLTTFHNTRVRPIGQNAAGTFIWLLTDWLWKVCRPGR